MNIFGLILLASLAAGLSAFEPSIDYCQASLCRDGETHIGCENENEIDESCADTSSMVRMSSDLKKTIVRQHNELRNSIASGEMDNYDAAVQMAKMTWDDELAYLAGLNVKTCQFAHDECRNTDQFEYSGQNLFQLTIYPAISAKKAILRGLDSWAEEHTLADRRVIKRYRSGSYGHFTVMVVDRNVKLGCATLRTTEGRMAKFTLACNYASTNILGEPIYVAGEAGSKCSSGRDIDFPALCSEDEMYDVNEFRD